MELNEADLTLDFMKPKFSFAFEFSGQVDDIRLLFDVRDASTSQTRYPTSCQAKPPQALLSYPPQLRNFDVMHFNQYLPINCVKWLPPIIH